MIKFILNDEGAVTVDWVVLTAGLVGLGLATMSVVSFGVSDLSNDTSTELTSSAIKTSFSSEENGGGTWALGSSIFAESGELDAGFLTAAGNAYGDWCELNNACTPLYNNDTWETRAAHVVNSMINLDEAYFNQQSNNYVNGGGYLQPYIDGFESAMQLTDPANPDWSIVRAETGLSSTSYYENGMSNGTYADLGEVAAGMEATRDWKNVMQDALDDIASARAG